MNDTGGVKEATNNVQLKLFIMVEDILIPLVVFGAIFGIVWVVMSTRNRERMAMIEKGVSPKDFIAQRKVSVYGIIKWALLLVGVGLGLFLGSILDAYTDIPEEPAYFAGALLFGGLGLVLAFIITKKGDNNGS